MTDSDNNPTPINSYTGADSAADMIRQKINALYKDEPTAIDEVEEVLTPHEVPLTKHQIYMRNLSTSGRSLADIQTAWHKYYGGLSDKEKHEVWQEFYDEHNRQKTNPSVPIVTMDTQDPTLTQPGSGPTVHTVEQPEINTVKRRDMKPGSRTVGDVKKQLLSKARTGASRKLSAKQHFQSLLFGVGIGMIIVVILLFGFFNDRFIAPFITPSKQVSSTPIIIDSSTASVDSVPKVLIPKINVEIPVVYDEPSVEESAIQKALERGVVHYATTPTPGENGNAVIFGHSSNNILNKGQYKFAFVLLSKLDIGDTFYLTKDNTRYAYRIYDKKIVKPTEVGVLGNTTKPATATLITCDPPGTSLNRLIVIGEQISPNPNTNKTSTAVATNDQVAIIPSNAPSLWQRIKNIFN